MANGPANAGNQVESVAKPDDQPKILGITEPLPEPIMSIMIVSNSEYYDEEEEEEVVKSISSCANPLLMLTILKCYVWYIMSE